MSLHGLPYDIKHLLIKHVCHLGDPSTLLALLLTHPSFASIFSQSSHALTLLLAHAIPRRRHELALGIYNLRRLPGARYLIKDRAELARYPEDGVLGALVSVYLLREVESEAGVREVLGIHVRAEAETRRRRERMGEVEGTDPYLDWYGEEMGKYRWDKWMPPKAFIESWVCIRVSGD